MTPIRRWGVELEAGWKFGSLDDIEGTILPPSLRKRLRYRWEIKPDESIRLIWPSILDDRKVGKKHVPYEIVVNPPAKTLDGLIHDLKILWPRISEVNPTMGMHVHVSFGGRKANREIYKLLATWDFMRHFHAGAERFKEIRERIMSSPYARKIRNRREFLAYFTRQTMVWWKEPSRYTSVNFPYDKFGSVEFRVFPMPAKVTRAIKYLRFVEGSISRFLEDNGGKTRPERESSILEALDFMKDGNEAKDQWWYR